MYAQSVDAEVLCLPSTYVPERGLLAAVLERAFRDLEPIVEEHVRREAVAWFLTKPPKDLDLSYPSKNIDDPNYVFGFHYIFEYLGLTSTHMKYIMEKVRLSEKHHEERIATLKEQRKKSKDMLLPVIVVKKEQ